jgi:hypothetical protein
MTSSLTFDSITDQIYVKLQFSTKTKKYDSERIPKKLPKKTVQDRLQGK